MGNMVFMKRIFLWNCSKEKNLAKRVKRWLNLLVAFAIDPIAQGANAFL